MQPNIDNNIDSNNNMSFTNVVTYSLQELPKNKLHTNLNTYNNLPMVHSHNLGT